jgi:hypothetical protein
MQIRRRHRNKIEIKENRHVVNHIYYNYFNGAQPQLLPPQLLQQEQLPAPQFFPVQESYAPLVYQPQQAPRDPFDHPCTTGGSCSWAFGDRAKNSPNTFAVIGDFTKGLQIGINYKNSNNELHGCIEDIDALTRTFQRIGFTFKESRVLTDDTPVKPTRKNMLEAIDWLVTGASPGDKLFFQYSGHGSQERGKDKYEADGMNETICPLDIDTAGHISDDEINKLLCKLPENVMLLFLSDCCHSGTNCDLPYLFSIVPEKQAPQKPQQPVPQSVPLQNPYVPSYYKPQPNNYNPYGPYQQPPYNSYNPYGPSYYYPQQSPYGSSYGPYRPGTYAPTPSYSATGGNRGIGSLILSTFVTLAGTVIERYASKVLSMFDKPLLIPREGEQTATVTQLRPENARARIITLSGCNDHETSQEFNGHGAMTTVFLKMLEKLHKEKATIKVEQFLKEMYSELIHAGTPQQPQICSSFKMTPDDLITFR